MAKGGAGKVYFVLYLAVILELLIIIVERDEAEEHLIQKQKETMQIVESILSQLQTGSGTDGISTQPKDEITLQEPGMQVSDGPKIRQDRTYLIEVGVTDVSDADNTKAAAAEMEEAELNDKIRTLIRLANVRELQYQVFFHPSKSDGQSPYFPGDDAFDTLTLQNVGDIVGDRIDGEFWRLQAVRQLDLDVDATEDWKHPVYQAEYVATNSIGDINQFAPQEAVRADSVFRYSDALTDTLAAKNNGSYEKRVFQVHFKAPNKPGWYKLRFFSRTNKILGVTGPTVVEEMSDDQKVNVGVVQLKVKELKSVRKELGKRLEGLNIPSADDLAAKSDEAETEGDRLRLVKEFDEALKEANEQLKIMDANGQLVGERSLESMQSQVKLYGYIAKLLAPGLSNYFDQNRASKEIDIRVIKPPVNIAQPFVNLAPEGYYGFDKLVPSFTFNSGPYQGNNEPTAEVIDEFGNAIGVSIKTHGRSVADAGSDMAVADKGKTRSYLGTIEKQLEPGKYTVRVTQRNQGKEAVEEVGLEVFETGLTEQSMNAMQVRLNNLLFGEKLVIDVEPLSGLVIPADQFRIYPSLDVDAQRAPVRGLNYRLDLPANAKTAAVRIAWVSPYNGEEIDIMPEEQGPIKQGPPIIQTGQIQTSVDGNSARKFKVKVRNIVAKPDFAFVDLGETGNISNLEPMELAGEAEGSAPGFAVVSTTIEDDGDGTYSVIFELEGRAPSGVKEITGDVSVSVLSRLRNPKNGAVSDPASAKVATSFTYELPRSTRGPGGGPPPRRR